MKKILVAIVVTLLGAGSAFAAASNITTSKHNLSSGSTAAIKSGGATPTTELCVFCHTPHNATVAVPLWNRNNTPATYTFYSSATLTPAALGASLTSTSFSMMCLSCHDGTVAAIGTRVVNNPSTGVVTMNAGVWTNGSLGSDLTNDHPIGFSYDAAATHSSEATIGLRTTDVAKTNGAKFFGPSGVSMECSSCHTVHNDEFKPFLRKDNAGSALCLACHIK